MTQSTVEIGADIRFERKSETMPLATELDVSLAKRGEGWRVILYNDDIHGVDEVILQLQKATGCDLDTAARVTLEVDKNGRGVCYRGERDDCGRVVRVLREIRLQCEVDDD